MSDIEALKTELTNLKIKYLQKSTEFDDLLAKFNVLAEQFPSYPKSNKETTESSLSTGYYDSTQLVIDKSQAFGTSPVGEGYYGTYYKSPVSIQTLKCLNLNVEAHNEFKKEVHTLLSLKNPHIAMCFAYAIDSLQDPFIIMEHLPNGSLINHILAQSSPIEISFINRILKEIALGMHYLHSNNLPHKMLSSASILLDSHYHAKVTNCGLLNTMTILFPQQNFRDDIFSYGTIAWELATQQQFTGSKPKDIPQNCNEGLKTLINMCWEEDVAKRPTFSTILDILSPRKFPEPSYPSSKFSSSINEPLAQSLKDKGNDSFRKKQYELAVTYYSNALMHCVPGDVPVLLSNRSAAFLGMGATSLAISDAKTCIEIKGDWPKGYFRLGKACMADYEFEEAYINFYRSFQLEKNEEVKKLMKEVKQELRSFGSRATKLIFRHETIKNYLKFVGESLCKEIGVNSIQLESHLDECYDDNLVLDMSMFVAKYRDPWNKSRVQLLKIMIIFIILKIEKPLPSQLIDNLLEISNNDAFALALCGYSKRIFETTDEQSAVSALKLLRDALILAPKDLCICKMYAQIVIGIMPIIGEPNSLLDISIILKDMQLVLSHPRANKSEIAKPILFLWFKLMQDPSFKQNVIRAFLASENKDLDVLLLKTLGPLSDPFFIQALKDTVLPHENIQDMIDPLRNSLISDEPASEFKEELVLAVALQMFRCNYAWLVNKDVRDDLKHLQINIASQLNDIKNGIPAKNVYKQICIYALFGSLRTIPNMESFVLKLNLNKLNSDFALLIKKTFLDLIEEKSIQVESLTVIPDNEYVRYSNSRVIRWDNATLHTIKPIKFQDLLNLFYPYWKFSLEGKLKVLVAGCSSGKIVYKLATTFKNIEIIAIDISKANLAHAIRQNKEMGVEGVKYYLADLMALTPELFPHKFDVVIAGELYHCPDPFAVMGKLCALLKSGGIFQGSLHTKRYWGLATEIRNMASSIVANGYGPNYKVLKAPTDSQLRRVRKCLFENTPVGNVPSTRFYELDKLRDMAAHPVLNAFGYEDIVNMVKKAGMKFVGFEFQQISNKHELQYKGEFYDDRNMVNGANLDKYAAESGTTMRELKLGFSCEKP